MDPAAVPRRAALLAGSRYELLVKIATGGTSTVYVGRISGSVGFSRLVAIKRAHPHLRDDDKARRMLIREATLASHIHHANVVPIQDVEETEDELLLVMDYIEGGALSDLLERQLEGQREGTAELPAEVAMRIILDGCAGLHAVHAACGDDGMPLGLVHRDVSPQNLLVGVDGTARLTDFGLAKLTEVSASATASVHGKIAYLAPEYVEGAGYTTRCDIFSLGVVVWETLAGRRLFRGNNDADTLRRVVGEPAPKLSSVAALPKALDPVLARALDKAPVDRYESVEAFAADLMAASAPIASASHAEVGNCVRALLGHTLANRRAVIRATADPEQASTASMPFEDLVIPQLRPSSSQPAPASSAPPPPASSPPSAPAVAPMEETIPMEETVRRELVRDEMPTIEVAPSLPEPELEGEATTIKRRRKKRPPRRGGLVWAVAALGAGAVAVYGAWAWLATADGRSPVDGGHVGGAAEAAAVSSELGEAPASAPPSAPEQATAAPPSAASAASSVASPPSATRTVEPPPGTVEPPPKPPPVRPPPKPKASDEPIPDNPYKDRLRDHGH